MNTSEYILSLRKMGFSDSQIEFFNSLLTNHGHSVSQDTEVVSQDTEVVSVSRVSMNTSEYILFLKEKGFSEKEIEVYSKLYGNSVSQYTNGVRVSDELYDKILTPQNLDEAGSPWLSESTENAISASMKRQEEYRKRGLYKK